ncbi:MAG: GDP-fucose synthetase [Sorangiineae bacterium NIC37A_2]|nr:MAG: GDP-fucose synthetase [Sorangiineae bacterium NIC37A_2]
MALELRSSKVLVTGGGGFLGTHVIEQLEREGATEIFAPRSAEYDLTNQAETRRLFESYGPDLVFHLAARVGGIFANQKSPGTFFHDNMAMGLHVLEEARRAGTKKVVIAGTICAYPKFAPIPFREDDLWNGYPEETNAPYGIAKKALLVMAQAYRQEFGSNFVMLFPVNLYGPKDNFDLETSHVIPAMIRKFETAREQGSEEVILWGDGSPTREFLFVRDAARGLVLAAQHYDDPEPVNLGAGFEITMRDLAALIAQKVGFSGKIEWDTSKPNGQPRRSLDVTRAKERFGFEAKVPFDEGLDETIRWYRANASPS